MLLLPDDFTPGFQIPAALPPATLWFVFAGHRLLVAEHGQHSTVLSGARWPLPAIPAWRQVYMGAHAGRSCIAATTAEPRVIPPGIALHGLRALWGMLSDTELGLAGQAHQLLGWDRDHRYCGRCGGPTAPRLSERARYCPRCGLSHYPRHAPAVMVRITRDDELLLARSPRFVPGMYSVLAGFVDAGETIEQAARREVLEEVGLHITRLRYFTSQSWPFPHSLMIAFSADYADGEIVLEDPEIEDAGWYRRDQLPGLPGKMSIARVLIDDWLDQA